MAALWTIDPDHSMAAFAIRYLMISHVRGLFCGITGSLRFDPADVSRSSVEATIPAASLYTGIKKRDDHLRSADFFEVEKYPAITFRSTKVEVRSDSRFLISGDLALHGVTRPVTFEARFSGPVKSPFGGETTIGFTATAAIDREAFGITWNEKMEGGLLIGGEAQIALDVQADLASE